MIAYVDDIHILSSHREIFHRALQILDEFVVSVSLNLNILKSSLWGSEREDIEDLSRHLGIPTTGAITTLGLSFPLNAAPLEGARETERLLPVREKLRRAQHLPASHLTKRGAISVGVLSTLDYGGPISPKEPIALRSSVKRTLDLSQGAPEIVFNATGKSTLDPAWRWFISGLRLWRATRSKDETGDLFCHLTLNKRNSRLSEIWSFARKIGWDLSFVNIVTPFRSLPWTWEWSVLRGLILADLKKNAWENLATRRPGVFGGLQEIDVKSHVSFLKGLTPYHEKIMLRIWAGCPMTLSHRHTLSRDIDPTCPCGLARQTVSHLLLDCPLTPPPTPDILALTAFPTRVTSALILPSHLSDQLRPVWKQACIRMISTLAEGKLDAHLPQREIPWDLKGHLPLTTQDSLYCYCAKCFVSRRLRDMKYLFSRPCPQSESVPLRLGDYMVEGNHLGRLEAKKWKISSVRPAFTCVHCGDFWWATSRPKNPCRMQQLRP